MFSLIKPQGHNGPRRRIAGGLMWQHEKLDSSIGLRGTQSAVATILKNTGYLQASNWFSSDQLIQTFSRQPRGGDFLCDSLIILNLLYCSITSDTSPPIRQWPRLSEEMFT